ncbi:hypothetical protein PSKAS_48910 [Peribacillus sp. N1]
MSPFNYIVNAYYELTPTMGVLASLDDALLFGKSFFLRIGVMVSDK